MTIYLLRHAKAGERNVWEGDDLLRPLSGRGHLQARGLLEVLADAQFDRLLSSPYVRCMETVVPLSGERSASRSNPSTRSPKAQRSTKRSRSWASTPSTERCSARTAMSSRCCCSTTPCTGSMSALRRSGRKARPGRSTPTRPATSRAPGTFRRRPTDIHAAVRHARRQLAEVPDPNCGPWFVVRAGNVSRGRTYRADVSETCSVSSEPVTIRRLPFPDEKEPQRCRWPPEPKPPSSR